MSYYEPALIHTPNISLSYSNHTRMCSSLVPSGRPGISDVTDTSQEIDDRQLLYYKMYMKIVLSNHL